jgi:hypothetical protein
MRQLQGAFYGQEMHGNELASLMTNAEGKVTIDSLITSEIAGNYLITACLVADTTVQDTVNLIVKVPNLVLFAGSGNYVLKGRTTIHPDNHYFVSQVAINDLIVAANAFAKTKWNTTGDLRLNDMSLEWGGKFDLGGKWANSKSHEAHRIGKSVDIENLESERIDTVSQKTGKDTSFTVPKVKWVRNFVNFMTQEMKMWRFVNEKQMESDVFTRSRRYPHFEWTGN